MLAINPEQIIQCAITVGLLEACNKFIAT